MLLFIVSEVLPVINRVTLQHYKVELQNELYLEIFYARGAIYVAFGLW